MPSATVFPGGAFEKADELTDWMRLYQNLGIANTKFDKLLRVQGPRPFIYQQPATDKCLARYIIH